MTVTEIRRLIEEAGRIPVERDTLYHEIIREPGKTWRQGKRLLTVA
jgi:aminodeoxyfutalosine synthase